MLLGFRSHRLRPALLEEPRLFRLRTVEAAALGNLQAPARTEERFPTLSCAPSGRWQ